MEGFLKTGKLTKEDLIQSAKNIEKASKPKKNLRTVPWVEKYRPKTVDDVVEQEEIVTILKQVIEGANLPHLLFHGPPGTGKTSTIIAASRQLFGDIYKERILELNASDDRGIQVIRDKVKVFAHLTASGVRPDGKKCPPYKIIILDEADSMTHAAQAALRRTMEKETKTTRFCLICNYVSSIIKPLTSRCTKFRFKALGKNMIKGRLEFICQEENVKYETAALDALVDTSGGDLRRAITTLQSCARLKGDEQITENDILEVSGVIQTKIVTDLIDICKMNNYQKTQDYIEELLTNAYSATQLIDQLTDILINNNDISDMKKANIFEKLALVSWRLQDGADEFIQLTDFSCALMNILKET